MNQYKEGDINRKTSDNQKINRKISISDRLLKGNDYSGDSPGLLQKVQYLRLDNLTLCFQQISPVEPKPVKIWLDTPSVQMNFVLEGERHYKPLAGYGPPCHLQTGHHSLGFYTAMNGELRYSKAGSSITVDLWFPESYLRSAFQNDLTQLGNLEKAITKKQSALIGNRTFPLTPDQKQILLAMYNCPLDGQLKKMFLEGKLLELLALQVNQFQTASVVAKPYVLTQQDVDKLQLVQAKLLEAVDRPLSINELSLLVGLNRTKLMGGFKELFGNTIYGYLADVRMERAKELIVDNPYMPVAEVSRQVGFSSPNNFSAAFKKKFGYSPMSLRQG